MGLIFVFTEILVDRYSNSLPVLHQKSDIMDCTQTAFVQILSYFRRYSYKLIRTAFIFAGIYFFLTALIRDVTKVSVRLTSVEKRLGRLEEIVGRGGNPLEILDTEFPVFKTMNEYKDIKNHPSDMVRTEITSGPLF